MSHPFIEHLKEDHEKQRTIGENLKEAATSQERTSLRQEMYDETYPHMEGEEASIFAFMQTADDDEAKEHALEAVQEHHVGKLLMRELKELVPTSEIFKAKASVLEELNRSHMDEEETYHFPWLERNVPAEELDRLFEQYEKAEEAAEKG